ncbi:putative pyridoxamine 5'-phosphate oxidase family protein [Sporomusaceae bacterium BoRhaA]|uniref:pyridoxamine 5'-phosphate oxidase family protein n=1 Tax=Pelorhabdus rhamnosifermentans TaxID=2772457 RepID=UPI001C062447|nr:pyridoxamine 5'-phosphate oxidase family protein [Pelorhabdus rhamnosifermentans]MBU2702800.1 putative pyridoxamine 5'-phosphate oxidase family protein [Pelorhabdus rhamnosifermentans]
MKKVYEYLKNCGTFYLATMDGDQPRVRPFGAVAIFEDKFYIQTGNVKKVFAQMTKNPKIGICAMGKDGSWIRVAATAIQDDRLEARQHMINENPSLKSRYAADDGNCEVLYLKNATATITSFTSEPKIINF